MSDPFTLTPDEPVVAGVHRAAGARLRLSLDLLEGRMALSDDEVVHEVRKRMKDMRGLLRLVGPGLPAEAVRLEDAAFKQAANALSSLRDARVMLDTLELLADDELTPPDAIAAGREALAVPDAPIDPDTRAAVCAQLTEALERAERWPLEGQGFEVVRAGLERTYRKAFKGRQAAAASDDPEVRHDWRKWAKYLMVQVRVLRPFDDDHLGALADKLKQLTEALGKEHDVALFRELLRHHPERFGGVAQAEALDRVAEARTAALVAEVFEVGDALFAQPVDEFVLAMELRWSYALLARQG